MLLWENVVLSVIYYSLNSTGNENSFFITHSIPLTLYLKSHFQRVETATLEDLTEQIEVWEERSWDILKKELKVYEEQTPGILGEALGIGLGWRKE